jgi:hypothetical protein
MGWERGDKNRLGHQGKEINMRKTILTIIFLIISAIDAFSRETHDYAIIQGKNVICREKLSINSKKIKVFLEGELVFDPVQSEKKATIGKDENFWYKIKTQDKKEGWVFGKYILVFDKNNELHREYQKIMNNELGGPTISKVKIEKDDKYDYILLRYLRTAPFDASSYLIFYVKDGDTYKKIIGHGLENDNYYINDKYIYLWSTKTVRVYDRNQLEKSSVISDRNLYYKWVGNLTLYELYKVISYDSYIEFDPKTEISTMHWREIKGAPMKIEKYKFDGTKFEKIE